MDVNIAVGLDLAHVLKNRAPQGRTIGRNTLIDEVLQAWGLEIAPSSLHYSQTQPSTLP